MRITLVLTTGMKIIQNNKTVQIILLVFLLSVMIGIGLSADKPVDPSSQLVIDYASSLRGYIEPCG